ncbi:MAG: zinc ribbon domain-containing protein [Minicystis sp.]
MPTYEYACTSCGNEWEFEQSIKDNALTDCPKCEKPTAKRQISRGTGFILKGGGWYSDLYSSSGNKAPTVESTTDSTTSTAKPAEGAASTSTSSESTSATPAATPAKSNTPAASS